MNTLFTKREAQLSEGGPLGYAPEIDKALHYEERSLRAYPGKLLFGPTGERLFADCLDKKPGMCGNIDFIHKINIDMLFTVEPDVEADFATAKAVWYPSKLTLELDTEDFSFQEVKMITEKDIAFCLQSWTNKMDRPLGLEFKVEPTDCQVSFEDGQGYFETGVVSHDLNICVLSGWDQDASGKCSIAPGETVTILAASAAGVVGKEGKTDLKERLDGFFNQKLSAEEYIEKYGEEYQAFFDKAPHFVSSDRTIDEIWNYRWYILRNATSKPDWGYLKHTTVYEGRAHKTGKGEPLKVSGWEFSRLICLSTPLQLTDYRWHSNKEVLQDIIRGVFDTADENGICMSTFTNHKGSPFANFIVWAVYRNFLLDGDKEFIKEMIPAMKKCVDGNTAVYGNDKDYLQIEQRHQRTGKEFQPSFWYFLGEYPSHNEAKRNQIPVKRMDTTVYHYLNIRGLAEMMEATGHEETAKYKEMADTLARQINEKMWDSETGFFYDLHHETDEKALVKNIVGVYPYWAEITDEAQLIGLEKLFDKDYFNTGSVFATTAKDCPAYSPKGGWLGTLKSRDGCVWDGPSWPYTNGIALEAIGRQSRLHNHKYDKQFAEFLRKYTMQHYRDGVVGRPYLVEQYHAESGENLSDEPDYNHSYYLDLIFSFVAGLNVQKDQVVVEPLDIGLSHFKLDNVKVRGHEVSVTFAKKNRPEEGIEAGLNVYVDGKLAAKSDGLSRLEVAI